MLTLPNEPDTSTREPPHSERYERGMALLFVLGSVGALLALLLVFSYFD
jgi:hypothetical protein